MKNVVPLHAAKSKLDAVEREAVAWLLKFDQTKPSKSEFIAFMRWYKADATHQQRFDELAETMDVGFMMPTTEATPKPSQKPRSRFDVFKPVAAAAMLLVAAFFTLHTTQLSQQDQQSIYATQTHQRIEKTLFDGSVVTLDSNSSVEIDLSANERNLTLSQGQAYFDVSHDKSRPFIVHTPFGSVTAVGTAFSVDVFHQKLDVVVTEGRVAIADNSNSESALALVDAGHQATLANQRVEVSVANNVDQLTAWRRGKLSFHGESLARVIAKVQRYHDVNIRIEGEELQHLTFGGSFDATNIDGLLESLNTGFNVQHRKDELGNLTLYQP